MPDLATGLRLLAHADLGKVARIRAFPDFRADEIARLRPRFEGKAGEAEGQGE
jgi:hypothetical protein